MFSQNPVFVPGPTNIPDEIRKACDVPTLDHRSASFKDILTPALNGVAKVIKSLTAEVFIFSGTGTGGWETAITNTLSPGDHVLIARNGMFSDRWINLCKRHGLNVSIIEAGWGQGLPADKYREKLAADKNHEIKAVLATHNETATGVTSDIAQIRRAIDAEKHPALLLVDGVSAIGSIDFRFDEWGVDIAVTGSQKGFMLPLGLAIVAFSPKAMDATKTARHYRTYFDIQDMAKSYETGGYPYTPPVGLLNGLKLACDMLLDESLENVFQRHNRIANGVRAAVDAWGLKLCAEKPEWYSDTVSAIVTPTNFDATALVTYAAERYNVAFGVGLGKVAGKLFRIGHLGKLTDVMALSGIATAEMCMVDLGLSIPLGSGVAAAQEVYRASPLLETKSAA
ncbi:MAG: aminotransferase class V-fold PLP-dependent enzyme [Aestuariivita sp.]|nr:aminotransferase class V-fold PLP-dependent enzyme [Aestuariivita sp.]